MTVSHATNATPSITSTTSAASAASSASSTANNSLTINDFMTLLATQFQEQDPLKPMDDTAFIAQTAQFTALQQATTMTSQVTQLAANDYIGRTVSVNNTTTGQIVTGTVTSVDTTQATPQLIIGGAEYSMANITAIAPTSGTTTTSN
jgi:flagellar basal-body rod modification protein FlgD